MRRHADGTDLVVQPATRRLIRGGGRGRTNAETALTKAVLQALGFDRTVLLFRQNTGALHVGQSPTNRGRFVRFGLAKGSSDLIGIVERVIRQEDVGKTVGVFTALEIKRPGEKPTEFQASFLEMIREHGGYAVVVRSVAEAIEAVNVARGGVRE